MAALDEQTEATLIDIIQGLTLEELIGYHQDFVEPNIPQIPSSAEAPEEYEFFAIVVDGTVSAIHVVHKVLTADLADALSSNPKIVKLSDDQKLAVQPNWTYDEDVETFTPNNA